MNILSCRTFITANLRKGLMPKKNKDNRFSWDQIKDHRYWETPAGALPPSFDTFAGCSLAPLGHWSFPSSCMFKANKVCCFKLHSTQSYHFCLGWCYGMLLPVKWNIWLNDQRKPHPVKRTGTTFLKQTILTSVGILIINSAHIQWHH